MLSLCTPSTDRQLKRMQHRLKTGYPNLATKVVVAVLFVGIVSTIIVVKLMHESHAKAHEASA